MPLRTSRRRALQTMAVAAAAGAAAGAATPVSAFQATPAATPTTSTADAGFTPAQVQAALDQLDDLIEDAMTRTEVPGVAVSVVYQDQVVYERGFGVRELGQPEAVDPETVFQIGSVSKSLSATTIASVISDGTITWDTLISDLTPDFALSDPWVSNQIALRDMFCHRSGLPAYAGDDLYATFSYDHTEISRRLRYIPLAAPFRAAYAYENTGLATAAFAVATANGVEWADLAATHVFSPLGMTNTSYRVADFEQRANRATPHYKAQDGVWTVGEVTRADGVAPAGGVSSNVRDMAQWVRLQLANGAYDGQQLIESAPLLETHRPQIISATPVNPADGPASFYGLAWEIEYDAAGRLLLRHPGDLSPGFRTAVYLLPAADLGVVVLTNSWPNPLRDAIPRSFFDLVETGAVSQDYVGNIERLTNEVLAQMYAAPFPQGDPPADAVPARLLGAYVAAYSSDFLGTITVSETSDGLTMTFGANPTAYALSHYDGDTFSYQVTGSNAAMFSQFGVIFTVAPDGTAISLIVPSLGVGPTTTFSRVETDS